MSKNNIRKLSVLEIVLKDEFTLHPLNLTLEGNNNENNKICPINHYLDEKIEILTNPSIDLIIDHMRIPNISISIPDLLAFYKITNIDSLNQWINDNNEQIKFDTINRVSTYG